MTDLASRRKELRLSQAAIAAKLGVHQTTIMRWETGELPMRPRDEMAIDVAISQLVAERDASPAGKAA